VNLSTTLKLNFKGLAVTVLSTVQPGELEYSGLVLNFQGLAVEYLVQFNIRTQPKGALYYVLEYSTPFNFNSFYSRTL
jgi:hypothetical protein